MSPVQPTPFTDAMPRAFLAMLHHVHCQARPCHVHCQARPCQALHIVNTAMPHPALAPPCCSPLPTVTPVVRAAPLWFPGRWGTSPRYVPLVPPCPLPCELPCLPLQLPCPTPSTAMPHPVNCHASCHAHPFNCHARPLQLPCPTRSTAMRAAMPLRSRCCPAFSLPCPCFPRNHFGFHRAHGDSLPGLSNSN